MQPFQHHTWEVVLSSNIALFQIKRDIIISLCDLPSDILCHKPLLYGFPDPNLFLPFTNHVN